MSRGLLVVCVCVWAATAVADEKKVKYPKLNAALNELGAAKEELESSKQDYGGKKDEALKAIKEADVSLRVILAVKADAEAPPRDKERYKDYKDHPHLRAAVDDLREARRELKEAETDFQGNRKEALKKIDAAVERLQDLLKEVK